MKRKILSLALCLALCLGLLPTAAMAAGNPLRNCRGATEVTYGSVTLHLSNPILDVVELDESSYYYSFVKEGTSSRIVYVVPYGTEISWSEDTEEFSAYSYLRFHDVPLFENKDDSYTLDILRPIYITRKSNGSDFNLFHTADISFCGIDPLDAEELSFTENTEVDLTQYGPVVFNNMAAKKTVVVDGETVPLYEIRANSGFWKYFLGVHGVYTKYDAALENGQLKKGEVNYTYDTQTDQYGANAISQSSFDSEDVGRYHFVEITGEPYHEALAPDPQPTLRFAVHVVPDQPTAYASTQTVMVDGKPVTFNAYALKDENGNDTNYVKLRDVADVLNGSAAQFSVGWDGTITIITDAAYIPNGTEMVQNFTGDQSYTVNTSPVTVNGEAADLEAITLTDASGGGYTYFKLRDLGAVLGFNVSWVDGKIVIDPNTPYDPAN